MSLPNTKHSLNKLEDLISETEYTLRYEKGNFKSGYCVIKDSRVIIVNKYYALEGKISCLIDIVKEIENVDLVILTIYESNLNKFAYNFIEKVHGLITASEK